MRRDEVFDALRAWRAEGRRLALATLVEAAERPQKGFVTMSTTMTATMRNVTAPRRFDRRSAAA